MKTLTESVIANEIISQPNDFTAVDRAVQKKVECGAFKGIFQEL